MLQGLVFEQASLDSCPLTRRAGLMATGLIQRRGKLDRFQIPHFDIGFNSPFHLSFTAFQMSVVWPPPTA